MNDTARADETLAGLVARRGGALTFFPAGAVRKIVRLPAVEPIPGTAAEVLGVTLALEEVMLVIAVGAVRRQLVVCDWFGEALGVTGVEPLATGSFARGAGGAVHYEGQIVTAFDFGELGQILLRAASLAGQADDAARNRVTP